MTPTERALILAKREGFIQRAVEYEGVARPMAELTARKEYPMTETKPRVILIQNGASEYCIKDNAVLLRNARTEGNAWVASSYTVEDFKKFGQIAASPTETVPLDEDGAEPAARCIP